jgi:hypothetical protein
MRAICEEYGSILCGIFAAVRRGHRGMRAELLRKDLGMVLGLAQGAC